MILKAVRHLVAGWFLLISLTVVLCIIVAILAMAVAAFVTPHGF